MARPSKPARLWLDTGRQPAEWYILDILDGKRIKQRTGCGKGEERLAQGHLAAYIQAREQAARDAEAVARGRRVAKEKREPGDFAIAELAAWAIERKGPEMSRPHEYAARWDVLLDYACEDHLDAVDTDWAKDFAAHVGSTSYARRCLEDLRAAGNDRVLHKRLTHMPHMTLPAKGAPRPDYLTEEEVRALIFTARNERDVQNYPHGPKGSKTYKLVTTMRYRWRHLVPYIVVSVLTCTRASRVYEASYVSMPGRPWIDLKGKMYYRKASGEEDKRNKKAPDIPIPDQLARWLSWRTRPRTRRGAVIPGDTYLVQWHGGPSDCRNAFSQCVERARERFPDLFRRPDGEPKVIVRHTLRHTGVTLLSQWGVPAADICDYAGMSPEVYARIYKHIDPEKMARVMDAMGGREAATPKGRRKAS